MSKRRSSRAVLAREKARELNAERRRREQRLEDLATSWFEAESAIADINDAAQRKIQQYADRIRGEADKETGQFRQQMADTVTEMLKLTGIRSVAERLGASEATIRGLVGPTTRTRSSGRVEKPDSFSSSALPIAICTP